jgi:dTMP kinase
MFIVFEWLDGSGSSTQAKLLTEYFEKNWKKVLATKEPNEDSVVWKLIREILQHKHKVAWDALQLLFSADRAEHLASKIEPALANWKIVISDRYFFSTIAFANLSWNKEWMEEVNKRFRLPDFIFLFKLAPEECVKRIESRWAEKELFEKTETLRKVWEGYEWLSERFENIHLIDASKSIEEIHEEIVEKVEGWKKRKIANSNSYFYLGQMP